MGRCILQKRRVGTTDIEVSQIGLGTVKFGRQLGLKYPVPFTLPKDHEIEQLLDTASELGINLIDTAPAYGMSEERLGKLLKGKRHQWVISTKAGEEFIDNQSRFDFSANAIHQSVSRSLQRLQTDYLDILFVHSDGDDKRIILQDEVFNTLAILKQEGKIRAFGMSTKTVVGGLMTIDLADLAMVTFNPTYSDEREVIAYALKQQKGIFIKKALASGHLPSYGKTEAISNAMRFIFSQPGVTSIVIGTINPLHLRENVESLLSR